MTKRGRRRLVLLLVLIATVIGTGVGGYTLLKWRRAQAIVDARRNGLEAYAEGRYPAVLEILGPHVRSLDEDFEVVSALAAARRSVEAPDGGHLQGAASLYRRAADLDQTDLESRLALLELLPDLGLLPELIIASDEVLELDPDNLKAMEARVQTFAAMGRWDEAVALAGELIQDFPEDARWRQLQVSAAYSAGLDQSEVLDLVSAWPASERSKGIDLAVRGVLLLQSENRDAGMDLLEQAVAAGAGDPGSLRDISGILGDVGRSDLAIQLFDTYLDEQGLDAESATIVADWSLRRGEREWLAALVDTASLADLPRAIVASRLAIFTLLSSPEDAEDLVDVVREAVASDTSVPAELPLFLAGFDLLRSAEDADFGDFLERVDLTSSFQSNLAVAICERLDRPELQGVLSDLPTRMESILVGAIRIRFMAERGRSIEALRAALDLASNHQTRGEPVVLLASLWSEVPRIPVDLQLRLAQVTGSEEAFDLLQRLREDFGLQLGIVVPYVRSAVRTSRWSEIESAVEEMLSWEREQIGELLEIHGLVANVLPETGARVRDALVNRAPDDPRVIAMGLGFGSGGQAGDLERLRRELPLRSEDSSERGVAWQVLLRNAMGVDDEAYLDLAREALDSAGDSASILQMLIGDGRTWSDLELTREILDRYVDMVGDSAERDVVEARWAMLQGTDAEFDAALARLDRRFVEGDRSLPISMALLSMMVGSGDLDASAIVRLGRQVLQDHPEAVEVYPLLISVMQDAGMLDEANQMLEEFESIDVAGVASGRQRVVQSLRTGDFETLAATMLGIAEATGDADDRYRLALARQATGNLDEAERLYLEVLGDGSSEFGPSAARALAGLLQESGRADRIEAVLSPHSESLPDGLVEILSLASAVGEQDGSAIELLGDVVTRHPDIEDGWELLTRGLLASGRTGEALGAARDGLRRFPDSRELARLLLGAGLVDPTLLPTTANELGQLDDAVADCLALLSQSLNGGDRLQPDARQVRESRDLVGQHADDLVAWSTAMAIHNAAGQLAECRALAISASRRFPDAPEPAEWRVRASTSLGDIEDAISACRTWRTLSFPNVRSVDETRAALELARGDGAAALRAIEAHADAIVGARDRRPGPYRALLASLLMTGDVRGARRLEGERFAGDPAARTTWAKLCTMASYRSGLEAMSLLEAATPPDPTSRSILVGQWLDFHRRHPDGEGLSRARQLISAAPIDPKDFESRLECLARADIARTEGDVRTQRGQLELVIDSYSDSELGRLEDLPPAERGERLMFLQPLIMAKNNLAMALLETGSDLDRAEQLVASCLEMLPNQPQLRDSHAQILLAMGRMSEAERSIVTAIRGAPGDAAILATAAQILAATGRLEEANLALQRIRDTSRAEPWPNRELQSRIAEVEAIVSGGA